MILDLEELKLIVIKCQLKNFQCPDDKSLFPSAICQSLLITLKGHE